MIVYDADMKKSLYQRIERAYTRSVNSYDAVLTQQNFLSRLYVRIFWHGTDDRKIAERILSWIPYDSSEKILDVPAGTAVFTEKKWRSLKKAEIICVDYSMKMLKQAEIRLSDCDHVTFMRENAENLPFSDQSFDRIVSMNGFHAFACKDKVFQEITRVLKGDGVLSGCFYVKGESSVTDLLVNHILSKGGWFTPPFRTKEDVRNLLGESYYDIQMDTDGSIVLFQCRKKLI